MGCLLAMRTMAATQNTFRCEEPIPEELVIVSAVIWWSGS